MVRLLLAKKFAKSSEEVNIIMPLRKIRKKKFIKKAIKKPGSLSRQLNIPIKDKIPKTLLNKIIKAKPGETIRNPTKKGKRKIKVTRLLERRAIFAKTLKKISEKSS